MYIDTAEFRHLQNILRKNLPEGRHDNHIRLKPTHSLLCFFILSDPDRCDHRNTMLLCCDSHIRFLKLPVPSLRTIRLRHCKYHLMTCLYQGFKRRHREIRRSHKNYSHNKAPLVSIILRILNLRPRSNHQIRFIFMEVSAFAVLVVRFLEILIVHILEFAFHLRRVHHTGKMIILMAHRPCEKP